MMMMCVYVCVVKKKGGQILARIGTCSMRPMPPVLMKSLKACVAVKYLLHFSHLEEKINKKERVIINSSMGKTERGKTVQTTGYLEIQLCSCMLQINQRRSQQRFTALAGIHPTPGRHSSLQQTHTYRQVMKQARFRAKNREDHALPHDCLHNL